MRDPPDAKKALRPPAQRLVEISPLTKPTSTNDKQQQQRSQALLTARPAGTKWRVTMIDVDGGNQHPIGGEVISRRRALEAAMRLSPLLGIPVMA